MAIIQVSGIVGHVDVLRYTQQGTPVMNISVADKRYNRSKREEETYWIKCVWFGKFAEKLAEVLPKAKMISITGRENYKIYNDNIDRIVHVIDHQILQFKPKENNQSQTESPYDDPLPFNNHHEIPHDQIDEKFPFL